MTNATTSFSFPCSSAFACNIKAKCNIYCTAEVMSKLESLAQVTNIKCWFFFSITILTDSEGKKIKKKEAYQAYYSEMPKEKNGTMYN